MIKKGWRRLLVVLSVLWLVGISAFVVIEKQSINTFDQFDKPLPQYLFWKWSPIDLLAPEKEQKRELNPKTSHIAGAVVAPVAILWLGAWAMAWVREGFGDGTASNK